MFIGTEKVNKNDWLKLAVEELNKKLNKLEIALLRDKEGEEKVCVFPRNFIDELKEFEEPEYFLGKLHNIFEAMEINIRHSNGAEKSFPVKTLEAYVNHEKGEIYAITKPEEYWEEFIEELSITKEHFVAMGFKCIMFLGKHEKSTKN